ATDLDTLSLYEWDDDYIETMLRAAVVPDGYVKLVWALAEGLDIRCEHVVSRIDYDAERVRVNTNRGNFSAKYAVVALPHPVLAADPAVVDFCPRLPSWKRKAIRKIGIGVSDKFYFLFEKPFWPTDYDIVGRVDDNGEGRWSTWINFYKYTQL